MKQTFGVIPRKGDKAKAKELIAQGFKKKVTKRCVIYIKDKE